MFHAQNSVNEDYIDQDHDSFGFEEASFNSDIGGERIEPIQRAPPRNMGPMVSQLNSGFFGGNDIDNSTLNGTTNIPNITLSTISGEKTGMPSRLLGRKLVGRAQVEPPPPPPENSGASGISRPTPSELSSLPSGTLSQQFARLDNMFDTNTIPTVTPQPQTSLKQIPIITPQLQQNPIPKPQIEPSYNATPPPQQSVQFMPPSIASITQPPPQPQVQPQPQQQIFNNPPPFQQMSQPSYQPPPQPIYQSSPSPPPVRITIEQTFSNTFDRSLNNFKRLFSSEFSAIMRQPISNMNFDVDDFSETLSSEVGSIIESPYSTIDINTQGVSKKVSLAIEEHTKPVTSLLAEAEARNSVAIDHHISELQQLQNELDSLRTVFKTNSDGILKELEKEKHNASSIRDAEQVRLREMEQRMRTLKLKQVELEARSNHQSIERDSLERSSKQFEQKKREWEEETLPMMYDEGGTLRQRILQELNDLKQEITSESFDDLNQSVDESLKILKEEGDNMRNELMELEMANRWAIARAKEVRTRTPQASSPSALKTPRRNKSVANEAQERLMQLRRQREATMRDMKNISDSFK